MHYRVLLFGLFFFMFYILSVHIYINLPANYASIYLYKRLYDSLSRDGINSHRTIIVVYSISISISIVIVSVSITIVSVNISIVSIIIVSVIISIVSVSISIVSVIIITTTTTTINYNNNNNTTKLFSVFLFVGLCRRV